MLSQQTLDKLYQMRLRGMAAGLQEQWNQGDMSSLSFEDRFGLLVDREWSLREDRRLTRRLQLAHLKMPNACVEDINFRHPRGLDKGQVRDLTTCRWVAARCNLIMTGKTGLGKTWLSCAFGNKACREGFSTLYTRVPRLIEELAIARADGTYLKTLTSLERVDLLILDDWGMVPLDGAAQHMILEVIDDRTNARSTIVTSQLPVDKWHQSIGDPSVADALLDRLISSSTLIAMEGESMRPIKSKPSAAAQETTEAP
jgi:DNA replication protein DnaC